MSNNSKISLLNFLTEISLVTTSDYLFKYIFANT